MNLAWYLAACTIALISGFGAAWMIWGPRRRPRHDQFAFESEPDGERERAEIHWANADWTLPIRRHFTSPPVPVEPLEEEQLEPPASL